MGKLDQTIKKGFISYTKRHFPKDAKEIIKRAEELFPVLYAKAPDIGGAENMMSHNLDLMILSASFYEASDHRIDGEAITEIAKAVFGKYRFLRKVINVNRKWQMKILRSAVYKRYIPYAKLVEEKVSQGLWGNTWRIRVNPRNTTEGVCFELVGCPLADYARANGYEELLPYMCATDHLMPELVHAKLIRTHTCATGSESCDYWYVGDESETAKAYADVSAGRDDTEEKVKKTKIAGTNSRRKVLVFGAGVIGSYLAHVLCEAGNEVTVLAREKRVESLNQNGLVIRHHLQRKVTKDKVEAVTSVEGRMFDAAFVVMPYHKLKMALPEIDKLQAKLLVLIGNDATPAEIRKHIKENAPSVRKILFGFQATAGKKEEDGYICERFGGGMDIGQLHGETNLKLKKWVQRMFDGTAYKLNWQGDMESYLICHMAAILPIGYLSYICDGNLRKSTGEQRKMMFQASQEAYEFLKGKGITIYPVNDDKFFGKGIRGRLMSFLYFVMAKTKIGDLVACEHCRNAVSEMEQLDLFYEKLMQGYPGEKLKTWQKLRSQMPSWEELHRKYGN